MNAWAVARGAGLLTGALVSCLAARSDLEAQAAPPSCVPPMAESSVRGSVVGIVREASTRVVLGFATVTLTARERGAPAASPTCWRTRG